MSTALLPRRLLALPLPRSHLAAPSLLLRHASTQSPAARSPAARVAAAQLGTSRRQLGTTSASRAPASTARDVANDAGSTVTGANAHTTQVGQSLSSSAQELKQTPGLKEIGGGIPQGAVVYGAAGLLPYAGTAVGTVWLAREASAAIEGTVYLSPLTISELKNIVSSSEIVKEDDKLWPKKNIVGKQELEVKIGDYHISFETAKIGSLVDVQGSDDPEGMRVFYYLVQDLKILVFSLISLHFKIKPTH